MSIEEIESVYNEIFQSKNIETADSEIFPVLQSKMPSALRQIEIVTLSSSAK